MKYAGVTASPRPGGADAQFTGSNVADRLTLDRALAWFTTSGPSKGTISDSTKIIDTSFTFDFDDLLAELI